MDEHERSSYGKNNNGLQLDLYHGNNFNNDMRSYSVNYDYPQSQFHQGNGQFPYHHDFDRKLKRAKTTSGLSSSKVWCFSDPEFKRKKRVASYRALSLEGKVKGSFRKSLKWIKERLLYGWS